MVAVSVAVSLKTQGHPFASLAAFQTLEGLVERARHIEADPAEHATREAIALRIKELDAKIADPVSARAIERQLIAKQISHAREENAPLREIHRLESNPVWRETGVDNLVQAWQLEREKLVQSFNYPVGFQVAESSGGFNQG